MATRQQFANYSADRCVVVFAGIVIQGFADGSFIRYRAKSDGFTSRVGSDSLVSHSRTNDPRKEISFILESTSSSNDALSALHSVDLVAPNGAGVGALLIQDLNGTTLITSELCRIMRHTDRELARETGTNEWTLEAVVRPEQGFLGGN